MPFSELTDTIILISALCLAITNIYNFVAKPHRQIKEKKDKELREEIETVLEEKIPVLLERHSEEVAEKRSKEREEQLKEIKTDILEDTKKVLDEIRQINIEQSNNIKILTISSKDMLRQQIMQIYHEYKKEKRFPIHVREKLDELYRDYKAELGNSYIDKYYNRMAPWETYYDEDEIEEYN